MKDRVPLHPGRVTMTPVPGQANTYDMVRADQPVEIGDALNKANLLPDDVVAYLGLKQSNPQPKDAFLAVADAVGDIKTTVRTDLGEDWLLCNGSPISKANYPQLAATVSPTPFLNQISDIAYSIYGIEYGNGLWVACGTLSGASYVFVSEDTLSWTIKKIADSFSAHQIRFANGKWVCCGETQSQGGVIIFVSDTPLGSWTKKVVASETVYHGLRIEYGNGTWCIYASGTSGYYSRLYIATDLLGSWTAKQCTDNSYMWYQLRFFNGVWVLVGSGYTSIYSAKIRYANDPNGTWNEVTLASNSSDAYDVGFYGSDWVVVGCAGTSGCVFVSQSIASGWSTYTRPSLSEIRSISCDSGKWNAVGVYNSGAGKLSVLTTDTPTGEWAELVVDDAYGSNNQPSIKSAQGVWVTTYKYVASKAVLCVLTPCLPTLSTSGLYNYMRAK